MLNSHTIPRKKPASCSTSPQASSSEVSRRPGKEKILELIEVEATQMMNRQTQLEEAVGAMSQEIGIIKQLLDRLLIPRTLTVTRGKIAMEERRAEQQAAKTTTRGKAALGLRASSQQVPRSQVESTHSVAPNSKRTHTKARPSRPHNGAVLGLPPRSVALQGSQEREQTGGAHKPLRNVFDRLGQNAEQDLHAHLDARRTSASSKKNDVLVFSPVQDEINELIKRLNKLAAKSSEATSSTTSSPFSLEIQQASLPAGFRTLTMTMYKGKTNPQDHLDAFND